MAVKYLDAKRIRGSSTAIVVGAATVWDSSTGIENVTISNSNLTATSDSGSSAWDNYQAQSTVTWNPANLASGEEFQVTFKVTDDSKIGGLAFEKSPSTDIGNFGGVDFGMYMVGNGGTPNYINCMESGTKKAELGDGTGSDAYDVLDSFMMTMDSAGAVKYFRQAGSSGSFVELTGGSRDTASGDYYLYHYSYDGSYGTVITSASPTQIKQDDKTTITNVPVGTRYEETDTRKIFRATETTAGTGDVDIDFTEYADQSTADTAWSDTGSSGGQENWARVNVSNDNLAFSLSGTDKNHTMSYDLQQSEALNGSNPSDSAWVMRFTLNFSTVTGGNNAQAMKFLLCDNATSNLNTTSSDFIGMKLTPSANKYYSIDGDNVSTEVTPDNEVALTLATSTTYYFEIKRLTTTSYIINRYNTDFATVQDSATGTCASTTDGLRYFRFVEITGGTAHTFAGVLDNFQLWNAQTTPDTTVAWKEKGTA